MSDNNTLFIVLGNLCFITMLLVIRKLAQKSSLKEAKGMLVWVSTLFLFFLLLDPLGREIRFLGMLANNQLGVSPTKRYVLGLICAMAFMVFLPCYQFFLFRLKIYWKREGRYGAYVYHNRFSLFIFLLWCINTYGAQMLAVAINDKAKWNMEMALGALLIVDYIGAVILAVFQGQVFVMTDQGYCYYSLKKKRQGGLENIESVELKDKAVILGIKGEELPVWCTSEPYSNLLCEQCKKRIKDRHHGEKGYEAI